MPKISLISHQKDFIENADRECILSGAYGGGKSLALCLKIVFLLTRYPKNRGFLARKTLQSLKSSTLKTLLDGDGNVPPALPQYMIKTHNKQDRLITLTNGSELYYGNLDIEFLKSMNLGFGAVDETTEITEEEWNALNGRLRLSGVPVRQIFGATNPSSPNHWIYNRFVVNPTLDEKGNPTTYFRTSKTRDNPYLPKEYVDNLDRTLFGHYHRRYVLGEWVGAENIVYDNFEPRKHIIKNFSIPKHWLRFRSIDFGYRAPFFCGWFTVAAEDKPDCDIKKNDIILYREIYYTQRTVAVNAKQINKYSVYEDGTPEKIKFTVADWDAGDRADLEAEGIRTLKANKDITSGIQRVRQRLGNADPTRGLIVEPRFFVFENTLAEYDPKIQLDVDTGKRNNKPIRSADEFMVYGWKKTDDGKAIKEVPEDDNNHAMDGIRYFISTYDGGKMWTEIPFTTLS